MQVLLLSFINSPPLNGTNLNAYYPVLFIENVGNLRTCRVVLNPRKGPSSLEI